ADRLRPRTQGEAPPRVSRWPAPRRAGGLLTLEELRHAVDRHRAADGGDALRERDVLRADLHAVLRVAAVAHAAGAHEGVEALTLEALAGLVGIEEPRLAEDGRADEGFVPALFVLLKQVLRARLQAAAAGDALRHDVALLLLLRALLRPGALVVRAVDRHPPADALEIVEEARAVDPQVAHERELAHRLQRDDVALVGGVLVDQAGAALPHAAVDHHRARAADLFQAPGVPHDGRRLLALDRDGPRGDRLQAGDDVLAAGDLEVELL